MSSESPSSGVADDVGPAFANTANPPTTAIAVASRARSVSVLEIPLQANSQISVDCFAAGDEERCSVRRGRLGFGRVFVRRPNGDHNIVDNGCADAIQSLFGVRPGAIGIDKDIDGLFAPSLAVLDALDKER